MASDGVERVGARKPRPHELLDRWGSLAKLYCVSACVRDSQKRLACPQIVDYAPNGAVSNWRDLMLAAVVVRSVLGVSPSAYQDACETMGPENAAVAVACILERANMMTFAGGYLRDLTRKADRGEFSLGPMIMAALRANGAPGRKVG